jgi:hypothetical protein
MQSEILRREQQSQDLGLHSPDSSQLPRNSIKQNATIKHEIKQI